MPMSMKFLVMLCIFINLNAHMVFLEEPLDFDPQLEVVACYLQYKNEILFLKRCALVPWPHTWGLPAGKIKDNQIPLQAIVREIFEETGLVVSQDALVLLKTLYVRDAQKNFVYHVFKCELSDKPTTITLAPDEHTEYQWLTPEEALAVFDLVPGEDECLQIFYKN